MSRTKGWKLYISGPGLSFRCTELARAINLSRLLRDSSESNVKIKVEMAEKISESCTFRYKLDTEYMRDENDQEIPGTHAIIGGVNLTRKHKLIQDK